jgi:ppGpp synthetase/RelA/SpoT-type nucleotidyltranferase
VAGAGSYAAVADAYGAERDKYRRLAELIATVVEADLNAQHLEVVVQHRAKDVRSFVKKALRKSYTDPLAQIGDKAGVRVIVHYKADVPVVEKVVETHCEVFECESKLDALAFDQLGYLGVHLGVTAQPDLLGAEDADLAGLTAEVQIHTKAQSAWAVVSHDLLYKSPVDVPSDLKRTITRLVALVELFDDEVARFQEQLREHPDFAEMQVLEPLDDLFVEFTDHRPDKALSAMVVPPLVRLYDLDPVDIVPDVVQPFVDNNRAQLEAIYAQYADDNRATPLLFQPEALLIFASLEEDAYRLREAWPSHLLPVDLLEAMASIWGTELDELEAT